jgi:aspartate/methionine/tyrosine aminotransferase
VQDWYGLDVPVSRIAVTVGASGAFPLAFLAAFDPGDRIALAAPFYPPYVNILTALGMVPVIIEAGPETRFQPSVEMLDRLDPRPDGVIVASPCNPAGTMLHPDELAAIARWCDAHGVRLISDEIYHGLGYAAGNGRDASAAPSQRHARGSALQFSKSAVVINSFSKYFGLTGWRIGWMVLPEDLTRPVERLAQNMFISAPHISQVVAEACFDCHDELQRNVAGYRRSRDQLLAALPKAGFAKIAPAEGAFYLWIDVTDRTKDSMAFCQRMLHEVGIAATPGVDFDRARGNRFIRLSYCGPEADMQEAAARLQTWA